MRLGTTNNAQEERLVVLDPRTKLYMLLLFNVIMFSSATGSMAVILKTLLAALAFLILLNAGKTKIAWIYLALYVLASHCEWVLGYFSGMSVVGFLVRFFHGDPCAYDAGAHGSVCDFVDDKGECFCRCHGAITSESEDCGAFCGDVPFLPDDR